MPDWLKFRPIYWQLMGLGVFLETINELVDARLLTHLGITSETFKIHAIKWGIMFIFIVLSIYAAIRMDNRRFRNVTQRLSESETDYHSLFAYNPDAIYICNASGKFISANPAFERLSGYRQSELKNLARFPFVTGHERSRVLQHFERAMQGTHQRFETTIVNKYDNQIDVDITYVPMYRHGVVAGVYAIAQDITPRKRAERELRETEARIRQAEKLALVGELAAEIAHEIRNPLTSIKGFLQLFDFGDKAYGEVVLQEVDRINSITNELLLLAKPQALPHQEECISVIIQNVIALIEAEANLHNVKVYVSLHPNLPFISCNKDQMKQVFINLIKNSIEAMPLGGNVSIEAVPSRDGITITITDDGPGIPSDRLSKIGEPFYTTKERGTGLGLMITYRIIQNHQGSICVESEPNNGTKFHIFLPAALGACTPVTLLH